MRQFAGKTVHYFAVFVILFFLNGGCEKIEESVIPSVSFSYTLDLTLFPEVNVAGNSVFIPNIGYGGVIVYCEMPGSLYAWDATCTFEANKSCILENEGVIATCPCCGSEYILLGGGFPSQGPATQGLRQYFTSQTNEMLRIYNP
jgi:nitrite reductase/ring-hydroxylating ferredoxin subunit